jgi:hypothetical protein
LTRVLLTALPFLLCFTDAQAAELYEQQALLVSMPCCKYTNYRCTNIRVNISRSSVVAYAILECRSTQACGFTI